MSDYEISQLASLSAPASGDLLSAVDISDTSTPPAGSGGSNKHLPLSGLVSWLASNLTSFASVIGFTAGTDTSATATASTPSLSTGTAAQLSTTQDVMLYIAVKTSIAITLAIGSASSASTNIVPSSTTMPVGAFVSVRIPKGWYVKLTCATMSDLQITQVTC